MEIHQLRYFVAVAEEGSFSHAADREHVSQPSLSQQIHKLEEELNQQLFDRLPQKLKIQFALVYEHNHLPDPGPRHTLQSVPIDEKEDPTGVSLVKFVRLRHPPSLSYSATGVNGATRFET